MLIPLPGKADGAAAPLDRALKERVRVEQMDVALRLAPITLIVCLSVVQVVVILFWRPGYQGYLSALEIMVVALSVFALAHCHQWRSQPKPAEVGVSFQRWVLGFSNFYGCLLATVPLMLFVDAGSDGRLLISATCAGLIATGMSVAVIPGAAIGFSGPILLGSFGALAMTREPFYAYVAVLLTFYAVFICFTIVHFSRLLTMRVTAQVALERQQELTNLLLNDFEENASDWLWEADADLRLHHVSSRLAQVAGSTERALQGLPLERLFMSPLAERANGPGRTLWRNILSRQAFNGIVLPLQISDAARWWCVSGKPIFDGSGAFAGYRGVGSDITEKKLSEERLSHLAMHDSLTELPNRLSFQQALDRARGRLVEGQCFAVLCLDLDEFKSVNDTFGHETGDLLLQAVAKRLRLVIDERVALARLAGDEFAILVEGPAAQERREIERLAIQIIDSLGAPFHIDGIRATVGVSIGIAIAPGDGFQEIMRRADLALYRTKSQGGSAFRFYEAEMDEAIEARRALSADLRGALDRKEFILYFQPLVSAQNTQPQGFEALLRWNHPRRGFVSPADFIPLAEETGVIIPLGEWIIREACRIAVTWPHPLSVAVNLSAIQFRHSDLAALVRSALRDSGLAAERLELEITESVFLAATATTHATLRKLRDMRVRLSLDDFGTGYSSLSYLRRVSFDKIKIDRSFVHDLPQDKSDLAIVKAIIDMATTLGMTITAEGVETEAQHLCLVEHGCHQLQGYLFGRPVSAPEAALLVARPHGKSKQPHAA